MYPQKKQFAFRPTSIIAAVAGALVAASAFMPWLESFFFSFSLFKINSILSAYDFAPPVDAWLAIVCGLALPILVGVSRGRVPNFVNGAVSLIGLIGIVTFMVRLNEASEGFGAGPKVALAGLVVALIASTIGTVAELILAVQRRQANSFEQA